MRRWYLLLNLLVVVVLAQSYVEAVTEPISVADVAILQDATAEAMLQALITNNSNNEQMFVYIVQIKDANGYTVQLSWLDETLQPQESIVEQQPLTIEMQDTYTAEIFVWSGITNPVPLSYTYSAFTFNPLNMEFQCKGAGECFEGSVTKIVDGHTIDVDERRIRLALVDTPERGEQGYQEATSFTSTLCPVGSTVLVDQDGRQMYDQYGRMVAAVYCDGALLNAELLFANHAVISKGFCKASEFGNEDWAKLFGC